MRNRLTYYSLIFLLIGLSNCNIKKLVPEGTNLYTGAKVKIQTSNRKIESKALKRTYQAIIKNPKPNKKRLGIYWKRQEPVIYDEKVTDQIKSVLENRAKNNGHFHAKATSEVIKKKGKARVKYTVNIELPSIINKVNNGIKDSLILAYVNEVKEASLLKPGASYSLATIKKERQRIAIELRKKGFYFFSDSYLKVLADTTKAEKLIDLKVVIKETVDSTKLLPQVIDEIFVYSDLNVNKFKDLPNDTLRYEDLTIIYRRELMKARRLRDAIFLKKGALYSIEAHQSSLKQLSFLENYQFIDIQFKPSGKGENLLNVFVKLTPRNKIAFKGGLGFVLKPGLYAGPEISLTYLNRNLFRAAEQLRISAIGNFNFPLVDNIASLQEQELEIELSTPITWIPFWTTKRFKNIQSKTKTALNIKRQVVKIPLIGTDSLLETLELNTLLSKLQADSTFSPTIALNNYEFIWSYEWRKRKTIKHELTPIDLVLQKPRYEVPELRELLLVLITAVEDQPENLLLNLEEMLIIKPSYTFLFDSRLRQLKRKNYYYRGKVTIAANTLLSKNSLIPEENIESQFFQLENDFRYFFRPNNKHSFGLRFISNVSIPFKNEVILPFFDYYNVGGSNSIRAFRPRLLGPGSVEPTEDIFFFTGIGDVMIESTAEWRPKIGKSLEMGFFLDAGNVWLFKGGLNKDDLAIFKWDQFYKQLGIGTGLGFRYNFDILLLRLDIAFPLTKPWLLEGERWVGSDINFGSTDWRRSNLTFNLAFGYSF